MAVQQVSERGAPTPAAPPAALEVRGLAAAYRGAAALTAGEIEIAGRDVAGRPSHQILRRRVGLVPEGRLVFAGLTVAENLAVGAAARTSPGSAETLDLVHTMFPVLAQRRSGAAGLLSGGEQQMLAIGRALMADPALMLLDEVSLGLAPLMTRTIFERLAVIRAELGVAMLVVEQNATTALTFCDRASILENGRVAREGSAADLREDPQVQEVYLGGSPGEASRSFARARRFRRRERWC
jgi:branched-chain amino acid transport system ATP-binding protein